MIFLPPLTLGAKSGQVARSASPHLTFLWLISNNFIPWRRCRRPRTITITCPGKYLETHSHTLDFFHLSPSSLSIWACLMADSKWPLLLFPPSCGSRVSKWGNSGTCRCRILFTKVHIAPSPCIKSLQRNIWHCGKRQSTTMQQRCPTNFIKRKMPQPQHSTGAFAVQGVSNARWVHFLDKSPMYRLLSK